MTLSIRPATPDDTAWYLDLVRSLAAEPEPQIPLRHDEHFRTPEQQAELFGGGAARGDLFLIAESNGDRVGEVNLRRGSRAAFQHSATLGIAVARPWRGKGVGAALLEKAMDWARGDGGLRRIELNVFATNPVAIRLYERFGFVEEGRRKDAVRVGNGFVDDLVMAYVVKKPCQQADGRGEA
jgi:RimJ/RimL family protein N-acetyltransferase